MVVDPKDPVRSRTFTVCAVQLCDAKLSSLIVADDT